MINEHVRFFSTLTEAQVMEDFFPLLYTRQLEDIVVGCWSLRDRISMQISSTHHEGGGSYWFSKHVILSNLVVKQILQSSQNTIWKTTEGFIVALFVEKTSTISFSEYGFSASQLEGVSWGQERTLMNEDVQYLSFISDIFMIQETVLQEDLLMLQEHLSSIDGVMAHHSSEIHPTAVLDTNKGPIFVGSDVKIEALSYIEGPCYIDDKTQILQAKIRGSYIGKDCRIGGEVAQSIILSYTNKAHEGFLGHSYVGSWVNLGALCSTSDLKNNYMPVFLEYEGKRRKTGVLKLGSLIGDFSLLSIGTLMNTGTSIGVGCNIADPGKFLPQYIPSFSWKTSSGVSVYRWENFIETLKCRMQRRSFSLAPLSKAHLQELYKILTQR